MDAWCRDFIAAERRDHQFLADLSPDKKMRTGALMNSRCINSWDALQ
jgi:hypothetical protein